MTVANLKAAATGQVAVSPVAKFSSFLDKLKPQLALALPKHMNADRMARLALTAFSTTPALQQCTPQSIAGCIMTAAQLGLEPGIGGQGYLIPYKTTCTFVPGWKGLVDLVARSGRATVWTGVVFEGDDFDYQLGDAPFCRHKPGDNEGKFTHVYAIGRVKDAQMPVIEVWTRAKVEKHLKQFNKVGDRHYAKASESNFEMYARKVALLQVLKYMPSSIELHNAVTVSHAAEEGRGAVIEADVVTVQEGVDEDTGEIKGASTQDSGPTYAQLADQINKATSRDTADLVLDTARHLPADQQKDLAALIDGKYPV
ncbi:recombinase RecT [Variovorax atrisoli]|uniref:recombinase RecT n=1 Tax=Variovorax atrisoli TaxID=3394203 RepID=UPI00037523D5|nr:recombinase RecT [Variovorax paradoxus]